MYFACFGWEFFVEIVRVTERFAELHSCQDATVVRIWWLQVTFNRVRGNR
jgi:hypothetical protein